MKKLFTTIALIAGLTMGAVAQQCYTGPNGIAPHVSSTPGLKPVSDSLPCAISGAQVNDTIYFTNFTSFAGQTVDSLRIDSIGNLPVGTCWTTNKPTNSFLGGESGVIYVHGVNHAAPGQYTLGIYITATAGSLVVGPYADASQLAGLYYYVRVICQDSTCFSIDTTNGKTHPFIPHGSPCLIGINEIQNNLTNVSVVPNPFTSTANVTFNSDVEGAFTVKMTNLLGEVVATKEISVVRGSNQSTIERNGLSSGIYILSITNGNGSISKKVILD